MTIHKFHTIMEYGVLVIVLCHPNERTRSQFAHIINKNIHCIAIIPGHKIQKANYHFLSNIEYNVCLQSKRN